MANHNVNQHTDTNFHLCIKVSVFFKKKESIDHETFYRHWQTVHAKLVLATNDFRNNIVRYSQFHQTPEMKKRAKSIGEHFLDFDACAEMWVRSWDDWLAFTTSDEYSTVLNDDCQSFMELPMTYMVGRENLVVGTVIPELLDVHGVHDDKGI